MKLSVVIPLFNKEKSIQRAINSVLLQTYKDFELLVVDDGSTDNSLSVVKGIVNNKLFVYTQKNQGVSVARNEGIRLSKSQYVCLLDADDEWESNHLENIVKLIEQEPNAGLYLSRFAEYDSQGKYFLGNISLTTPYFGEILDFFKTFANSRSLVCSSNSCINKVFFEQLEGGFPVGRKVGEDIYVWLKIALISKVLFSSEITSLVHRDAENRTQDRITTLEIGYHHLYFSKNICRIDLDEDKKKSLIYFLIKNAFIQVGGLLEKDNRRAARENAKKSINYNVLLGTFLYLCTFLPSFIFSLVRNVRNKITTSLQK